MPEVMESRYKVTTPTMAYSEPMLGSIIVTQGIRL